jgi:hypothetical protein
MAKWGVLTENDAAKNSQCRRADKSSSLTLVWVDPPGAIKVLLEVKSAMAHPNPMGAELPSAAERRTGTAVNATYASFAEVGLLRIIQEGRNQFESALDILCCDR